jgi:hypothetical protein
MQMRCYLCGALIAASVVELLNASSEHNVCEGVHDCVASIELGLPPQSHTPEYDDGDQRILITEGRAFRETGSPLTWVPINLRFDDALELRENFSIQ